MNASVFANSTKTAFVVAQITEGDGSLISPVVPDKYIPGEMLHVGNALIVVGSTMIARAKLIFIPKATAPPVYFGKENLQKYL